MFIRSALLIALATFGFAGHSLAQSIDYGALEDLFSEPVTTSVTGSPQRASEVPATLDIITAADIRRSGARDLPGVLRHIPGVDVLQTGNDNSDVSIRGYNQAGSSRILVLIDGRQVYADHFGFIPWATLPVELQDIRQIEIVRGPNGALFGFNALRGVINIVTFHPFHDDVDQVSVTGGTQELQQGSAAWSQRFGDRAALRFSLGGNRNDDFSTPQEVSELGSRIGNRRLQGALKSYLRLSQSVDLTFDASHAQSVQAVVTPQQFVRSNAFDADSLQLLLAADTGVGLVQARVYSNWVDVRNRNAGFPVHFGNQVTVAQLQDAFKAGARHTLRLGVEFRHNGVNVVGVPASRVYFDVVSANAMWNWKPIDELSVINAVRLDQMKLGRSGALPANLGLTNADWNERRIDEISFNSGLNWQWDERNTLRIQVGRGVQLPSLSMLGALLRSIGPGRYLGGNPYIEPTIDMHYEIAVDRTLSAVPATLRVALFYDKLSNLASPEGGRPPTAAFVDTSGNLGSSTSKGLEITFESKLAGNWQWGLGYAPLRVADRWRPDAIFSAVKMDFQDSTATQAADARLSWSRGPWEVDGFLRYKSTFYGVRSDDIGLPGRLVRVPAHASLDGRVGYTLSAATTIAVTGQNLLTATQKQTSVAEVERRVLATVNFSF